MTSFDLFIARNRTMWLVFIVALGVLSDQASKLWAQKALATPIEIPEMVTVDGKAEKKMTVHYMSGKEIVVIPNAFSLIYKENPAAAFSLTSSLPDWFRKPMLLIISLLATAFFLVWYFRLRSSDGVLLTAFCLIMAGAVGNFIDRVRLGYVIDFLDAYAGFLGYPFAHWPTFNVADSCIVVGAILVGLRSMWAPKDVAKE